MIPRRDFVRLLSGAAAAWPLAARAQQPQRMRRLGVLMPFDETDPDAQARLRAFEDSLQGLGWMEGRDIRIDRRWAGGESDRIRTFAQELVHLRPDVILAHSTPAVAALQEQTRSLPVVFANLSDPLGSGFVESFARPGGNITGFVNLEASLIGKWLELLQNIFPALVRIGLLFNPRTAPQASYYLGQFKLAVKSLKLQPVAAQVEGPEELEPLIMSLSREPNGGLVVMPDNFTNVHRKLIIALGARYRVPIVYPYRYMATEGGLLSYGVDQVDIYRRAATYVDRILKGARPSDLPVQLPTKFELVINLKTAKALDLTVPLTLQAIADAVIE